MSQFPKLFYLLEPFLEPHSALKDRSLLRGSGNDSVTMGSLGVSGVSGFRDFISGLNANPKP